LIRSIYAKIFLWFWAAAIAATAAVSLVTVISGSQPLGRRWMSLTADLYGRSAVEIYQHEGTSALERYMGEIEQSLGIHATLIDPQGKDILGKGFSPKGAEVLAEVRALGKTRFRGGLRWNGAAPVSTSEGTFVLVAEVNPWKFFGTPTPFAGLGVKLVIALLATGLLCAVLARHIAAPIRTLQATAGRIANGDLSVRAMPAIAPRNDELADLAQDFDRMAERIQRLLQKQQELLGDISHELRSPLTRLNVSLELLRHGDTASMERMQTDLDRLDALIGQVLTLTRLQVHEGQKLVTSLNLRPIVAGVAEDASFEGKNEGKSVVVAQADDCWLSGDPALLRSCIENVVRNAVRYTRPQTGVILSLLRVDGGGLSVARVVVSDHGPGVPAESLSRLFEPFYRVSESRDAASGGFGLGLAIAQRVTLLHGGRISARNREAGGLEVTIELPLRKSSESGGTGKAV